MSRPADHHETERGAVLAISAISMIMLLVFTAFAIDLGSVYLHRQEDQTATDIAVIAAGFDRYSAASVTAASVASLNENLGTSFTAADMNTCGTVGIPAGWTAYTNANCLTHDQSWTRLMLRVPPQTYNTTFAKLAGIDSFSHTAFAVVSIEGPTGGGGVLPVVAQANAGSYQCLKVGASNVPDDQCNDNASGNFGLANFSMFDNEAMGTTQDCNGDGKKRMSSFLAMGIDHDISRFNFPPHNGTMVVDTTSCGATPAPNAVTTVTGNVPNWVGNGMIDGDSFTDGRPARLRRTGGVG
ncbi:MAG: Tad domain-containing protein, partial [Actinomycetota bacterium]|nr:Tad domain-containing protein [Actinomycetota bacterium]